MSLRQLDTDVFGGCHSVVFWTARIVHMINALNLLVIEARAVPLLLC